MIDFSNNTHTELSVYTIPQRETKKHYDNVINWLNIEQLFVFQQLALMIDFFFFQLICLLLPLAGRRKLGTFFFFLNIIILFNFYWGSNSSPSSTSNATVHCCPLSVSLPHFFFLFPFKKLSVGFELTIHVSQKR